MGALIWWLLAARGLKHLRGQTVPPHKIYQAWQLARIQ